MIEHKLEECAQKKRLRISRYCWNLTPTRSSAVPHRLDLRIGSRTARIYFTDRELAQCDSGRLDDSTALRLDRLIERIAADRTPLPVLSSFKDLLAHVRP